MGKTLEIPVMRICAALATVVLLGAVWPQPAYAESVGEHSLRVQQGVVSIEFDSQALAELEWHLSAVGRSQQVSSQDAFTIPVEASSTLQVLIAGDESVEILAGALRTHGGMTLGDSAGSIPIEQLAIELAPDGIWKVTRTLHNGGVSPTPFELANVQVDLPLSSGHLSLTGDVTLAEPWAHYLGLAESTGAVVGLLQLKARVEAYPEALPVQDVYTIDADIPQTRTATATVGPDLFSADMFSPKRWWIDPQCAPDINAYSIGTAVCNIGDLWVNWFVNGSDHPVVIENMYRLEEGRFEQIGMSWAKHIVFFPSSTTICSEPGDCTLDPTGQHLGVGCSDWSTSTVNGAQITLGPRDKVNAATGEIEWPIVAPDVVLESDRRMQVHNADIDPTLHPDARYYFEIQHIAADDAAAGNDDNNASYREATIFQESDNCYQISTAGRTQRGLPAILAWQNRDPLVTIEYVDVPGDGQFILGSRMTVLEDGMWHYEYALLNLNSDRSGQQFSVPFPAEVTLSNVSFNDIDYHSGSTYNPADWTIDTTGGEVSWAGETYAENTDANALRWGTLYNFGFDAQICPVPGHVTLGLFKPGDSPSIAIPTQVPGVAVAMVISDPPEGAIDARQPLHPVDSSPTGWQNLDITFTNCASGISDTDFLVEQAGGIGSTPDVDIVDPIDGSVLAVTLSSPINTGAWTTITHNPSGTWTKVGYLPADVDGSRTSDAADATAWIAAVSAGDDPLPIWSTDINRSSTSESEDLLRIMDLLNGTDEFDSYMGVSLP